jgi:hypothetical protein
MQGEEGGEWTGSGGHLGQAHNQAQEKIEILKMYIPKCSCQHTDDQNTNASYGPMTP